MPSKDETVDSGPNKIRPTKTPLKGRMLSHDPWDETERTILEMPHFKHGKFPKKPWTKVTKHETYEMPKPGKGA